MRLYGKLKYLTNIAQKYKTPLHKRASCRDYNANQEFYRSPLTHVDATLTYLQNQNRELIKSNKIFRFAVLVHTRHTGCAWCELGRMWDICRFIAYYTFIFCFYAVENDAFCFFSRTFEMLIL